MGSTRRQPKRSTLEIVQFQSPEVELAERLAWQASELVMRRYGNRLSVDYKDGDPNNPVTDADQAANSLLVEGIGAAFPGDAILAEESAETAQSRECRQRSRRLWCIDPIDGTREFIDGTGDFAVMIGLALEGRAQMGMVLQPTRQRLLLGVGGQLRVKEGAQRSWHVCRPPPPVVAGEAVVAISRRCPPKLLLTTLEKAGVSRHLKMGSIGLKMAAVALGEADVYASLSTTMCEWDTCAPEAICLAAGGVVSDVQGERLVYNKALVNTPGGVVATRGGCMRGFLRGCGDWLRGGGEGGGEGGRRSSLARAFFYFLIVPAGRNENRKRPVREKSA